METEQRKYPVFKRLTSYLSFKKNSDQNSKAKAKEATPAGCFVVHVGHERQRFVIRTEYLNHPLFKTLLEDAESEYGFKNEGPLMLPCDVDLFHKVLDSIVDGGEEWLDDDYACSGNFACSPFNQGRRMVTDGGSYDLLVLSP